ncbi:MAG: MBG domain-containing protein, partial [Candidatus Excrementavichristensenella sp.]
TYEYDGTEKTVTGYEVTGISNDLYTEDDFTFSGNATVSGTNVGIYDMDLKPEDFTNISGNFTNVKFVIVDGALEITPVEDEVVVTITENGSTYEYDGTEKTVTGYEVTGISNPLYTVNDFTFSGNATVSGTNVGIYDMDLKPEDFENISGNFTNVKFVIVDGALEITPVEDEVVVIITGNNGTYRYDGTEKTVEGYEVTGISNPLYTVNDFTFSGNATVSGTNVGIYDMDLKPEDFENISGNFTNVKFVIVDGALEITPVEDEVVVIITGNNGTYRYDGTEKTVEGYEVTGISNPLYTVDDFTFSGDAIAKGTNVGTYHMDLKPEDFANSSDKLTNVTFVIVDGRLRITPIAKEKETAPTGIEVGGACNCGECFE